MNIFCCFGKGGSSAVSEAETSDLTRFRLDTSASTNQFAQSSATQETTPQEVPGQPHNVFAESGDLASDFFVWETDSQLEARSTQEMPRYSISKKGDDNTLKYVYPGVADDAPMKISKNFSDFLDFDYLNYERGQTNFEIGTDKAIGFCKEFLSIYSASSFEDLVQNLGQKRADLAPNNNSDGFGVMRTSITHTVLIGPRYGAAGEELDASYNRRLMQEENSNIQVIDLSDLDDEKFSQLKEAFLNGGNYYVEYQPQFRGKNDEFLNLTSFVKSGGNGIAVHPQARRDFYVPFDYIQDGAQDFSSVEGDFVSNLKSQRREEFAPRIGVKKICHPTPSEVAKLFEEMGEQLANFRGAVRGDDKDQMLESGSNLAYLFSNAAPYERGSAWAGEVIASSVMQLVTGRDDIKFTGTNLDFVAFGNSASEFKEALLNYVSDVSVRVGSEKT